MECELKIGGVRGTLCQFLAEPSTRLGDCASSEVYLMDCMELMAQYPDNYFDLAVVDPPYGINASEMTMGTGKNKNYSKGKKWDSETPLLKYFTELFRVSQNQIIWGGNYFTDKLPISKGWIYWDKMLNKEISFADGELAWTSFNKVLKTAKIQYSGFLGADNVRIHPTQKPVKLYDWIFKNYATEGMKILDTHLGSGSSRISANKANLHFTGCEIDKEYFDKSQKRYNDFVSQVRLF
jgi:site-specific DNA-methyltransferase (adenine-specific)